MARKKEPKDVTIHVKLGRSDYKTIKMLSEDVGASVHGYVKRLIEKHALIKRLKSNN